MPKFWLITFEKYENRFNLYFNQIKLPKASAKHDCQLCKGVTLCLSRHGWGIPSCKKSAGGTTDNS